MASIIQIRRDTSANWTSANPILAQGELGVETNTNKFKVGNGSTAWNSLSYLINTGSYLTTSDIGSTVQAYDADLTSWAAIAPSAKQDALTSGTNIKTVNGSSLLGSGDVGTIDVAHGGTGVTTTPPNGTLLIGNGTGYTNATLTAGSNITITNSSGGITIASTSSGGVTTGKSIAMAMIFGL